MYSRQICGYPKAFVIVLSQWYSLNSSTLYTIWPIHNPWKRINFLNFSNEFGVSIKITLVTFVNQVECTSSSPNEI